MRPDGEKLERLTGATQRSPSRGHRIFCKTNVLCCWTEDLPHDYFCDREIKRGRKSKATGVARRGRGMAE